MLNLLNTSVWQYLKDNVVLTVVLALILALIAVLSGIMIYLQIKAKKQGADTENAEATDENSEEPTEESTEETAEESTQAPAEEIAEEAPITAVTEETDETPVAEEKAEEPAAEEKTEEPATETAQTQTEEKAEPVIPPAENKPAPAKKPAAKKPIRVQVKKEDERPTGFQDGKWVIRKAEDGKYNFKLYAANGSVMLESGKEYSSLSTAKQGIATYKKNFAEGNCKVVTTKPGHFVYKLTNANGMLLAVSPNYTSKSSCENALENTKTYASGAHIEVE